MSRSRAALAWFGLAAVASCAGPPGEERMTYELPPREGFAPVAAVVGARCGSLDCHGQVGRSLRVYDMHGLRLGAIPGEGSTSVQEIDATYEALVAVDPDNLALAHSGDRQALDAWMVLAKGRGEVSHKGHDAMPRGSSGDQCLTAWIAGTVLAELCLAASEIYPPSQDPSQPQPAAPNPPASP